MNTVPSLSNLCCRVIKDNPDLEEKIQSYPSHCVPEWIKYNTVALESLK